MMAASVIGVDLASADQSADVSLVNGKITTFNPGGIAATAMAIRGDTILKVGTDKEITALGGSTTKIIDLQGRRVIPGLNDSHLHFVRGSLSYNLDVRWDGVPSLKIALDLLRAQVARTPRGQWVRVGGGWSEFQFKERRPPTISELNAVAPDTPIYVLYFYDKCFINAAGMRALGMNESAHALPGGVVQRDAQGKPTGVLIAHPLPATITAPEGKMPSLSPAEASNSVCQFMRELNRLGMTSVIDPGGVGQPYPQMYGTISGLADAQRLSLRLGMYLLPQDGGHEVQDFRNFMKTVKVGGTNRWFRLLGGGEILVQKAMDWDLYTTPPVTVPRSMVAPMAASIEELVDHGWYVREHATFDNTISIYLDAIKQAMREKPKSRVRWAVDHAELISDGNLMRIAAMGGGIALQHRAAFHGELGATTFGQRALTAAPPVKRMLQLGIPVGMGTDATRDTSYNPWVCIRWLVSGKTVGGTQLSPAAECIDVSTALKLYTSGSAWFSGEEKIKGLLAPGMLADFAVLSQDVLQVPAEQLTETESVLTVVGGRAVFGSGAFANLAPAALPVMPDWSPTAGSHPGYYRS